MLFSLFFTIFRSFFQLPPPENFSADALGHIIFIAIRGIVYFT